MERIDPTADARAWMVRRQIENRGVRDPRVLAAMREVPRERFVPDDESPWAFDDHPLPIGHGQTISQPYIVALMTEALALEPHHRALEIGAGSGYQSAILARLCRHVCALERDPMLAAHARVTLTELGVANVDLRCGDGFEGWPEPDTGFDAILIACATRRAPHVLLDQLAAPGRMVVPLGPPGEVQDLRLIERGADGRLAQQSLGLVRFVPMVPGVARRAG
jgi:protein-L-isoaspartate(D-aspartate) O-methyltransferase